MSDQSSTAATAVSLSPIQTIVLTLAMSGAGTAGLNQFTLPDIERRIDTLERDVALCQHKIEDAKDDIKLIMPSYSKRKEDRAKTVQRGPLRYKKSSSR